MGKTIIITNPRPTKPGSMGMAIVSETDRADSYAKAFPGLVVEFKGGPYEIGDVMQCNITSATTCDIGRLVGQSTLAAGKVTRLNIDRDDTNRCEFLVETLCDPNPYNIKLNDKLSFKAPNIDIRIDQDIACIPTALGIGALIEVLQTQ